MEAVEKNIDILQLNMTGIRVFCLFSMLLDSPKTIEEINDAYDKNPLIKDKVSYDTIRNDINALRDSGCVISRTTKVNNKYALLRHPFELDLSLSDIKLLKKIYNKIYTTLTFNELYAFDEFFNALASYTSNEEKREVIVKISKIYDIDKDILKDLLKYSNLKKQITILYKSQTGKLKEHVVIAEKVEFRHDKLYFFGFDFEYNKNTFFFVNKISKILDVKLNSENREFVKFKAKYKILNTTPENYMLSENERIVEIDGNDLIIEAETNNDFIMTQNILTFGKNCVVLEPLEYRKEIVNTIKMVRKMYDDEE